MLGTYYDVEITLKYSERIEVFVPDGESVSSLIEDEVDKVIEYIPPSVDTYDFDDYSYKVL